MIRREFDIGEGDAYNKTLIDRAEKHLKDLNYFKSVKITTRPGSAPDRVVLDVETVDQATGDFNVAGGYSTTDGWMGEVKVGDRNFLGSGDNAQAAVSYGQYGRGANLSITDPSLLGNHVSGGVEVFDRQTFTSPYQSYGSNTYGANFIVGTPVTETTLVQWRYSLYDQNITIDPAALAAIPSLPVRQAAAAGRQLVSAAGETVTYNTLDNNKAADQRHPFATAPGPRRPRRRREIPADLPKTCATIIRSAATSPAWCARRAAISPAGAASRCR